MNNHSLLVMLVVVLIIFVVLLTVLGIVFAVALRRRTPVVKVIMKGSRDEPEAEAAAENPQVQSEDANTATSDIADGTAQAAPIADHIIPEEEEDDEAPTYVTEGQERVSYNRSMTAKLCQLTDVAKEWYSGLKNELLSYNGIKARTSWKHETFRIGRMVVARFVVRGKTLCLLVAVEPDGYKGTKFSVRDVSNIASLSETPTMYRIRKVRRYKYAKEMIAGIMKELKIFKNDQYIATDYFMPYEGDMSLMQRGLVKRVVSNSTRTFKIEEVDSSAAKEAAATKDGDNTK